MSEGLLGIGALCHSVTVAQGGIVLALLLAGAAGSVVHCVPMCGAFVLGQTADRMARVPAAHMCEWHRVRAGALVPYHLGRITTYSALGALAAASGLFLSGVSWIAVLSALLLLLAALLFLAQAARRLMPRLAQWTSRARPVVPRWSGAAVRVLSRARGATPATGYMLGVALGFLPCGFLYGALAAAGATLDPLLGALGMMAFGLGTVPSLVVVGVAGKVAGIRFQRAVNAVAPAVLLLNATLLLALAWMRVAPLV